jgi:polyhydroxybutyrate depolymerase
MYEDRAYIVHIPELVYPEQATPVLFAFHGAGGRGADMQTGTGFDIIADQELFIAVYPDGATGNAPWNVGKNVCPPGNLVSTNNDDIAYFDAMLDAIEQDQCIDRKHVFVTGMSMGGYFSHELGCKLGNSRLRAIAPHSAGTHSGECNGTPLPVLMLHGDSDSLINYRCAQNARDYWVDRNGCSAEVDTLDITGGHCDFNRDCPKDGPVVLCTFNGLDHAWAYPPMYDHSSWIIWTFFKTLL